MGCLKLDIIEKEGAEKFFPLSSGEFLTKSGSSSKNRYNTYPFGFNGMESDNELKGNENSYDFGARIYDPRLGRWLSVDPLQKNFPSLTPYNSVNNNPILFIDPTGKDHRIYVYVIKEDGTKIHLLTSHEVNNHYYKKKEYSWPGSTKYSWRDYKKTMIIDLTTGETTISENWEVDENTYHALGIGILRRMTKKYEPGKQPAGIYLTSDGAAFLDGPNTKATKGGGKGKNIQPFLDILGKLAKTSSPPKGNKESIMKIFKKIHGLLKDKNLSTADKYKYTDTIRVGDEIRAYSRKSGGHMLNNKTNLTKEDSARYEHKTDTK